MLTFRSNALSMKLTACRPFGPTERIPANPAALRTFRGFVSCRGLPRGPPEAHLPSLKTLIQISQEGSIMLIQEFVLRFASKDEGSTLFETLRRISRVDTQVLKASVTGWVEWPPVDDPGAGIGIARA